MAVQAAYQLAVMSAILWDNGAALGLTAPQQATFVFNTFVVMQLFNQVACRKAFDEPNFLEGLPAHRTFAGIVAAEVVLQARTVLPPLPLSQKMSFRMSFSSPDHLMICCREINRSHVASWPGGRYVGE